MEFESYIDKALSKLSDAEEKALKKIGILCEAESKLRCPVNSGTLRRSISHKINESNKSVAIGSNIEYAEWVEKGTSNPDYPKQSFLEPSIEDSRDQINEIIKNELRNVEKR